MCVSRFCNGLILFASEPQVSDVDDQIRIWLYGLFKIFLFVLALHKVTKSYIITFVFESEIASTRIWLGAPYFMFGAWYMVGHWFMWGLSMPQWLDAIWPSDKVGVIDPGRYLLGQNLTLTRMFRLAWSKTRTAFCFIDYSEMHDWTLNGSYDSLGK